MKFFRAALILCLVFALAYFVQPVNKSSGKITPLPNNSFSSVGPENKVVAFLPPQVYLVTKTKNVSTTPGYLGIQTSPNLSLKVKKVQLSNSLDSLGIDSNKSATVVIASISKGISRIYVEDKFAEDKTEPAPEVAKPAPVVPDYVPPAHVASPTAHTYTYCVAARGVDASFLPELQAKLASVYSDARGWSLGGVNSFVPAASGCSLTVWLTAADQMPSFGAICDSMWSCTVYPNVILNFDRWRYASPAWNGAGGSLDSYRTMVINHETGHWLGFGHRFCAGAGQPAPVMQQQSISLQGCAMNPWPLDFEKAAL